MISKEYIKRIKRLERLLEKHEKALEKFGKNSEEFNLVDEKLNYYLYDSRELESLRKKYFSLWESFEKRYLKINKKIDEERENRVYSEEN